MAPDRNCQNGKKAPSFLLTMMMLSMAFTVISMPSAAAADGDGDGIDDALDDCEFASGNSTVDYIGCPDDDGDGVPNFIGQQLGDWGATQRELYHSGGDSRAVAWSHDGRYIAGAGGPNVNLYWAGGHISTLYTISENVRGLAFSPNGSYLAVGGYEEDNWAVPRGWMVVLEMDWATQSATVLKNLSHLHIGDVPSVAWSSDGLFLYTGAEDEIRQFSVNDNWAMTMNYSYQDGNVWALDVSPDDRLVAGISGGGQLVVYWTANGTQYMAHSDHSTSHALALRFSPDGRWLVSGGNDNDMHIYNVSNKSWEAEIDGGSDVYGISFDPSGEYFVIARGGSSSTRIYMVDNWTQVASFGSFGTSNNNRGLRAVDWSPDGSAIAFAQRRGRITTHLLPESYMQVHGDWAANVLEDSWRSTWPAAGQMLKYFNTTAYDATNYVCQNDGSMAALTQGHYPIWVNRDPDFSTNGRLDCKISNRSIIEVPIGHIAGAFAVKAGSDTQTCIETLGGGLSIAQIRWMISAQSGSALQSGGEYPGMVISSVAQNDDGDIYREWSDLHSSCPSDSIILVHQWENRSAIGMLKEQFLCDHCTFKDSLYSTGQRERYAYEFDSEVIESLIAPQGDTLIGFTELDYMLQNTTGLFVVPIINNWTHSASDALYGGGTFVSPSNANSTADTWRIQSDLRVLVHEDDLADKISFIDWTLSEPGQIIMEDSGYNRLSVLDRVLSWKRIGMDLTYLLPDADGDGIWDGDDACANTTIGSSIDENGCADYQLDDDDDGYANDIDDCINQSGTATISPYLGCPDDDGDGYANVDDIFPLDTTQWRDSDGDGYGDNQAPGATTPDDCIDIVGNSTADRLGCPDSDGDGWSDADAEWTVGDGADAFVGDPTQWVDFDGDGYGDNYSWNGLSDNRSNESGDAFFDIPTQWRDRDGDGYGDNSAGAGADYCPYIPGTSTKNGIIGCIDSDGDGWADSIDDLPDNHEQWSDIDSDGYGDNIGGQMGDWCQQTPVNEIDQVNYQGCGPSERDNDDDGINDNLDRCPDTPTMESTNVDITGCSASQRDLDRDGVSEAEDFDDTDPSQSKDTDGDGFGDNASGTNGDDCLGTPGTSTEDRRGCLDSDGDGYSDPDGGWTTSHGADKYLYEASQWRDTDGDGYGDNWDNSTWNKTRSDGSPGVFVSDAYKPDRCPSEANSYGQTFGCPEGTDFGDDSSSTVDVTSSQSDEEGGGLMIIIAVIGFLVVGSLVVVIVFILLKPSDDGKGGTGRARRRAKSGKGKDYDPYAWTQKSSSEVAADDDGGKSEEDESDSEVQDESNTPETSEEGAVGAVPEEVKTISVDNWESLPPGGEYSTDDETGTVWYEAPDGESWHRNDDESWSIWE